MSIKTSLFLFGQKNRFLRFALFNSNYVRIKIFLPYAVETRGLGDASIEANAT